MKIFPDNLLLSETELRELLQKDDRGSFNMVYTHYWPDLYKAAFAILKDRDQSMDIVQDIFVWLWEHRKQLVIKTSLKGYLLTAVKFKTANYIRNGKIRNSFFKEVEKVSSLPEADSVEFLLEIKELENVIRQAVNDLPDKCKTIYQLSRAENLSNQQIARQLDISVKTVENQMTIALKRLRVALVKFFFCMSAFACLSFLF